MAGLAALAFVVPVARDFFELQIGTVQLVQALAIGAAGAVLIEVHRRWLGEDPADRVAPDRPRLRAGRRTDREAPSSGPPATTYGSMTVGRTFGVGSATRR